ncbi:Co2+/Mg2+ efflux protein ApaG [Ancylobacter sonchi]|uniref:Co2+/Mg2+ efflux protein ApaG n=1 Tax=Ancylobacter sonchi TaxID=1937790 RepID=UPI001BD6C868|nr:Co2+/Mg2+ efflux protein ApaG [Ancylobacter sonchi]MBS7536872.1 Co2+/Mg2+ efflux protein ApaG [Ancylobacter sonchi]
MYRATTRGVQVTVTPRFASERSDPARSQYFWAYTIEIVNLGASTVQLMTRHWIITDALGRVQEVRGAGVVGEQPVLPPGAHFEYTSGVPLPTSTGSMEGSYGLVDEAGAVFDVEVPGFSLDMPGTSRTLN